MMLMVLYNAVKIYEMKRRNPFLSVSRAFSRARYYWDLDLDPLSGRTFKISGSRKTVDTRSQGVIEFP
ncbi:MAG: hypothetical protein AB1503_10370 [Bacillota bacterium]